MKLNEIINLLPGDLFKFRDHRCCVVWTEFARELVDTDEDGKEFFLNDFNMNFSFYEGGNGKRKDITIHSSHPKPEVLELKEFSKYS